MEQQSAGTGFQNRREFFRIKFNTPVRFKAVTAPKSGARSATSDVQGTSQNVSQSGILFQTDSAPQMSSILWMNVDLRTLKICQEIESRAIVHNNGVLGKVVRVEEDAKTSNSYDVGVCFITQDMRNNREVQQILSEIEK